MPCPLCQSPNLQAYAEDKRRAYLQCQQCALVFADPTTWPTADAEKAEYDLHENDVGDAGYNRFLARMHDALLPRLKEKALILDFGCGPAPALARQLVHSGHTVELYDINYYPDASVLNKAYDAIVMTEVLEHLHDPMAVLQACWQHLSPNGILAIMTQRVISQERFQQWNYKNDPTHVCFYSEATFEWVKENLSAQVLEYEGRDMVFFKK